MIQEKLKCHFFLCICEVLIHVFLVVFYYFNSNFNNNVIWNMNLALRQVLSRQTFRLCDRFSYKCLPKQIAITSQCPVIQLQLRNYCEERVETKKLPQLMEFPPIMWPSFLNFIKNWMFANFIIRPYFDQEFSLNEFIEASKHAVQVCFSLQSYS